MKRHHYLIVDSETTRRQTVADFGAVVIGRDGRIVEQFGALVFGHFGKFDLFADPSLPDSAFWSEQSAQRRMKNYHAMIDYGERSISSPALIQQWLWGVNQRYQPTLTAYNLVFDFGKCQNTRINLGIFSQSFCLMKAAKKVIGIRADYQQFCYDQDLVTKKMRKPQMTADAMAKFIIGNDLPDEPHTALEDARDYERAILAHLLKSLTRQQILELGQ